MENSKEIQELLININQVLKSGINKIIYDIQYKKLTEELNNCKAEIEKLKRTYENKQNIELQINENSSVNETKREDDIPKYETILKDSEISSDINGLQCENCDDAINPNKEGYHILYKKNNPQEEQVLCGQCYDDLFDEFKNEGWCCDDEDDELPSNDLLIEKDSEDVKEESVAEEEEVDEEVDEEVEEEFVADEEEEVEEESVADAEESVADAEEEEEVEEESVAEEEEEEVEVEEEEEEEVEEESVADAEEEEEEVEVEEDEEEEEVDEEEEVFEIEIDDITYYATNEENGPLYEVDKDGDPGNKVGYLKDGEPFFY